MKILMQLIDRVPLQPADLVKWKQVAARFSELITEAPEQLQLNENQSYGIELRGNTAESAANVRNRAVLTV